MEINDEEAWLMAMTGYCPSCKRDYLKITVNQRFCSKECRRNWHNEEQKKIRIAGRQALEQKD